MTDYEERALRLVDSPEWGTDDTGQARLIAELLRECERETVERCARVLANNAIACGDLARNAQKAGDHADAAHYALEAADLRDIVRSLLTKDTDTTAEGASIRVESWRGNRGPVWKGHVCSFCATPAGEAQQLVAGPLVHICDRCVAVCVEVMREAAQDTDTTEGADEDKGQP